MTTLAVTGASGHLGANLIRELLRRGETVRALTAERADANVPSLRGLDIERVQVDIRDADSVRRGIAGAAVVYHLAARISVVRFDTRAVRAVNVDGVANVVDACLDSGVQRLVHVSSIHALSSFPARNMVDEGRPPTRGWRRAPYDRSKALGEAHVRRGAARGLDAVVLNPTGVIGPFDFGPSRMGRVFLDLWHRRLPALVDGGFDWVDVRDVVGGLVAAAEKGTTGDRYVLSGTWTSMRELARLAAISTGVEPPGFTVPMGVARAVAPAAAAWSAITRTSPRFTPAALDALRNYEHVSHANAATELGYAPRALSDTIDDIYAWFTKQGLGPKA